MSILQQIALTKIKGVGPKIARNLLAYCGSTEGIFTATKKELLHIPNIGKVTVDSILNKECLRQAEEELKFVEKHRIEIVWIEDSAYPKRLLQCEDAPLLLYFKGNATLNPKRCISVVGTRNATNYGKQLCDELIQHLGEQDVQIVSGLAYGIDVQAHRQSVKHHIPPVLSKDQEKVYHFIKEKEMAAIDDIIEHLDWPMSKLAMVLLELEMNNIILSLPGKTYRLL